MTRLAVVAWSFGLVLALLWMFLLGLFMGKGITPANINLSALKKRMISEGVWPGSGKTQQREQTSQAKKKKNQIPLKDLEFYEKLAKKKAQLQKQTAGDTPPQKGTSAKVSPRQNVTSKNQQRPSPGQFTVQLASFKDLASAKRFAARFKDLKPRATIRQADLTGSGRWYRVQVGELRSRDEAQELAKRFREKYRLKVLIVTLDGGGE